MLQVEPTQRNQQLTGKETGTSYACLEEAIVSVAYATCATLRQNGKAALAIPVDVNPPAGSAVSSEDCGFTSQPAAEIRV